MSDIEKPESPPTDEEKKPEPPSGERKKLPKQIAWTALRIVVVAAAVLLVAHWLAGVWANGWFQLGAAALLCLGLPLLFQFLIHRKVRNIGGKARFRWLTLAMVINAPALVWVGARSPATFGDALADEGLGSLKWIARTVGGSQPGNGVAEETDETGTADEAAGPTTPTDPGDGETADAVPVGTTPTAGATGTALPLGTPIPFENTSGQVVIQARIGDAEPMPFVLDTGATYSTLSSAALASLGIEIPADAPDRTMRTAGGEAEGPMVLLDRVTVGDQNREGVAFWVCEPCATETAVGLLGLNLWQGFLLTIDPSEQNVWLQPKEGPTNRLYDVESFLEITSPTSRIEGETVYVDLLLSNGSRRDVEQAVVLVTAMDEQGRDVAAITVDAGGIPGLGSTMATGTMPKAGHTAELRFSLIDARW